MKCPHCRVEIHAGLRDQFLGQSPIGKDPKDGEWLRFAAQYMACPACGAPIVYLTEMNSGGYPREKRLAYPQRSTRAPAPTEVPSHIADDYNEAGLVLGDSPKASAALSRRCLQAVLRDKGYSQHDLAKQIDAVLAARALPSGLAANVDAIRNIGNFAAHPMKDTSSGQILPVEPDEAEWNLDVLDGLFDFLYVGPAKDAARQAAMNAKLAAVGKPPMK